MLLRSLLATAALALAPLAAEAAAGKVLFALGRVEIQRNGQVLAAPRGTAVEVGDTVTTGPTGMAQVRLQDGGLLSLRYGSSMRIEDFHLPAPAPAAVTPAGPVSAAPTTQAGGRSVLRLLRGAFRTITGVIGRNTADAYSVVTPVATIGIRGTDYSAAFCDGDCGQTPDGLYVGVSNGGVEVENSAGTLVLGNDQYGYVKDASTAPGRELAPPAVLETPLGGDDDEEDGESAEGADTASRDAAGPEGGFGDGAGGAHSLDEGARQPEGDYELRPGTRGSQASAAPGIRIAGQGDIYLAEGGAMGGFLLDGHLSTIGTAENFNVGGDAATGLRWGRWHGGTARIAGADVDLTAASLHWIYAPVVAPVLSITGTRSYTLVGNTNPTGSDGSVGFLGDATLFANFTTQTVDSTLSVGFGDVASGGTLWQASGSGSIQQGLFDGSYSSVTVNGDPTGTSGAFSGFFTPEAAAAGLTFELSNGQTIVNGAAGFAVDTSPPQVGAP
jgi:hypothetical protein